MSGYVEVGQTERMITIWDPDLTAGKGVRYEASADLCCWLVGPQSGRAAPSSATDVTFGDDRSAQTAARLDPGGDMEGEGEGGLGTFILSAKTLETPSLEAEADVDVGQRLPLFFFSLFLIIIYY